MNPNKVFAVCGIISPILYLIMVIIGGALIPGYSHLTETVSELLVAGAPNRSLLASLMIGSSVLGILFPIGLHRGINEGMGSKVGPVFLVLAAALGILTTYFPQDPGGPPVTFAGTMHVVLLIPMVVFSLGAFLAFWKRLPNDSFWAGYAKYSLVTFIIAVPLGVISAVSLDSPYLGLLERIGVAVILQWGFVMAIKLYRLSRELNRSDGFKIIS